MSTLLMSGSNVVTQLVESVVILNVDKEESTIFGSELVRNEQDTNISASSYVVSDSDEELLVLISFNHELDLKSIKIHSIMNEEYIVSASGPKQISIYHVNHLNINFDDMKSMKPDKTINCDQKKLKKGQNINLQKNSKNAVKFKKTKTMIIYIKTNQNDTECTLLNAITFKTTSKMNDSPTVIKSIPNKNDQVITQVIEQKSKQYEFDERDTNNLANHELNELATAIYHDNTGDIEMNSGHLFKATNIYGNLKECKLDECNVLNRINEILSRYHIYMDQQLSKTAECKQNDECNVIRYNENYGDIQLLNDFNHLMCSHSLQFEDVYNSLCKDRQCNLKECLMMTRNNRDRLIDDKESYFYADSRHVIQQQLLDRIHSHFCHSYDIGYKIKRKQLEIIMEETKTNGDNDPYIESVNKLIQTKQSEYSNIEQLQRLRNGTNKFAIKMYDQQYMSSYSYGYRYFYWEYYKNNFATKDSAHFLFDTKLGDQPEANVGYSLTYWYMTKKFDNFKEELLSNDICVISSSYWFDLTEKAKIHIETEIARSLWCYDMNFGQMITTDHLIAMMVYCNCDLLQRKFTETFRRQNSTETDKEMMERHKNYYHLGKLLLECVECHGMKFKPAGPVNMSLFHGVTDQFIFQSLNAYIGGPLSTTTEFAVATNFCKNTGMILNIDPNSYDWCFGMWNTEAAARICCFDCSWLSDYSNEQEIFFIGGLNKFTFMNIVDTVINGNYYKYIHGIKQMTYCMGNGEAIMSFDDVPSTFEEKQMVFRLLSHELNRHYSDHKHAHEFKSCPVYIKDLLHNHCENIKIIEFMNRGNEESKVHETLFKYDNGWIKIKLVMVLFPNTKTIKFNARILQNHILFIHQPSIYFSVLNFIQNNRQTILRRVELNIHPIYAEEMKEYVKCYCKDFLKLGWCIYVKTDNIFDGLPADEEQRKKVERCRIIMEKYKLYGNASDLKKILEKLWKHSQST